MVIKSLELAKLIRDIYINIHNNYSNYQSIDLFTNEYVDTIKQNIFTKDLEEKFKNDVNELKKLSKNYSIINNDGKVNKLAFSDNFIFTKEWQVDQKNVGKEFIIKEILGYYKKENKKINIVSLGIGNGALASKYFNSINSETVTLTGIDLYNKNLQLSKQEIPFLNVYPPCDLNTLSADNELRIPSNSVDIIECSFVAHHVEKFDSLISEVHRILKKEGIFCYLDLTDETCLESEMIFQTAHQHPPYHGMEFFRNYKVISTIIEKYFVIEKYNRIGPGILFTASSKRK